MDYIFALGVLGGLTAVAGAAWPDRKVKHAIYSKKNWLLALGALLLFAYAIVNHYFGSGPFFFIIFELLIVVASIMMMIDLNDKIDTIVIGGLGALLILWSLTLYEDYSTLIFIAGLTAVGLGHAFQMGSKQRMAMLTIGSGLIALFSYISASWVFFWLNVFFALFSAYYWFQLSGRR